MNKQQKEILQAQLDNEKAVLNALKKNYKDALTEINSNLSYLMARQDADMQHVIYQAEYQQALKTQVQTVLDVLQNNEFNTVSEYLTKCYEEGFVGTMYDLQSQGIPLIFPIDQESVVRAIQHDTKLSTSLYKSFDMKELKKKISGEISRGISNAVTYNEIARNISGHANVNLNNAMRIARTEGHRINIKSAMDAQQKAKSKGADIVKQWDASLDGKTRPHHRELDGQIREIDEDFEYSGGTVSAPSHFGDPSEDCNCRCALLQRARWALGEDITKYSPDAAEEITDDGVTKLERIKAKDYAEFKKKYMSEAERVRSNAQKMNNEDTSEQLRKYEEKFKKMTEGYSYDDFIKDFGTIESGFDGSSAEEIRKANEISEKIKALRSQLNPKIEHTESYNDIINSIKKEDKIEHREVNLLKKSLTDDEIIKKLGGGDMTDGSCSSLALAYAGNKNGFDVTDYRGGQSQGFFASKYNISNMIKLDGVKGQTIKVKKEAFDTAKIIKELPLDKEYYLGVAKHTAIIKNTEKGAMYLELQSTKENGWKYFESGGRTTSETLMERFKARKTVVTKFGRVWEKEIFIAEVDSFKSNEVRDILGYLNTATDNQKKGASGYAK